MEALRAMDPVVQEALLAQEEESKKHTAEKEATESLVDMLFEIDGPNLPTITKQIKETVLSSPPHEKRRLLNEDCDGLSPLNTALSFDCCDTSITPFLLEHGASVEDTDEDGNTVLAYAVTRNKNPKVIYQLLITGGYKCVNARNNRGETPFFLVIENANPEIALLLLKFGADPTIPTNTGKTPLAQTKYLLRRGSNFEKCKKLARIKTILEEAIKKGQIKIALEIATKERSEAQSTNPYTQWYAEASPREQPSSPTIEPHYKLWHSRSS